MNADYGSIVTWTCPEMQPAYVFPGTGVKLCDKIRVSLHDDMNHAVYALDTTDLSWLVTLEIACNPV
jgi:hypothetical protein